MIASLLNKKITNDMKKSIFLGLAAVAALGFASCNNSGSCPANGVGGKCKGDKEVLYSGILPAADAQGTVYTLKLEFDDDNNYTDGDYVMIENTLQADSVDASGLKDVATSYTKGDFNKLSKVAAGDTIRYIKLVPDAKDALGAASASSQYFIVNPDESLTMVGEDLVKSETGLNYTLSVVK